MYSILAKLTIAFELQHTEAIKRAVGKKLGIGCLSKITLQEAFMKKTLAPIYIKNRDFSRQLYFITHKKKFHSQTLQKWLTICNNS
jgi:DNA-binding transcriptional LysR family regulator